MRRRSRLVLVFSLTLAAASHARAEILDRILAVVDNQVITLSDARAALRFALVPEDVSVDPVAAAMQRLIDRRLMLAEVDRYAPPEPLPATVDAAVAAIERRFKDRAAMEAAMSQSAMSRDELRRYLRDSLRIDAYLQQRFSTVVQPSEDDLVRYYRAHSTEFTAAGGLRPFDEVKEDVRAAVAREQRGAVVQQWVEGLRRRGSVQVLYLPQSAK